MQKLGALTSAAEAGAGNRQSAYRLDLDGGLELFARRGRRGGLIAIDSQRRLRGHDAASVERTRRDH